MNANFELLNFERLTKTYSVEELITRLKFENDYLEQFRPKFSIKDPFTRVSRQELLTAERFGFVREYNRLHGGNGAGHCGRHLIVANEYPRVGREYANGFIHRRVKCYQQNGLDIDVVAFGKRVKPSVLNYDGVDVLSGYVNELRGLVSLNEYDSVSLHFANAEMWKVLKNILPKEARVFVYVHGFEADNWIRRTFQLSNSGDVKNNIKRSFLLKDFWQELAQWDSGVNGFIFVSKWWRDAISADTGIDFRTKPHHIIHNVIDEDLYNYVRKDPSQRFKILWVRSAHTKKYAADIAVDILRYLKKSPLWGKIEVRVIGDGQYMSLFENEFCNEENVTVERRFASQVEISKLHKEYGLFLVPTRYDSQGVSRDEAMSSGLVPITNPVSAVPEFVDEECAILGDLDEPNRIAEEILEVMRNPDKFLAMSEAATQRVHKQCGTENTTNREQALMEGKLN